MHLAPKASSDLGQSAIVIIIIIIQYVKGAYFFFLNYWYGKV